MKQTIKVPDTLNATGFDAIQTYNYDELNRLKSAEEKIANVTSWKQTYTFDRYGNRRFDEANTDTLQGGCATAVCNPTIDPATNKLIGYTFDNAGNTKVDASGQTFTYDAENKQIKVIDSSSNTVGEYFYDGDGKRIKKVVPNTGETTIFVYDASGKMVAEYSTNVEPTATAKVSYLTSDHLGSPRITTDKDGDVYTRRDFMPFGEEIDVNDTPERTATLNYASDEIRQKFTSYERDNETDLDFAQARMFNYGHGRFNSSNPYNILFEKEKGNSRNEKDKIFSRFVTQPANWNRYVYVLNNPLKFTDPLGLIYLSANGRTYYYDDDDYAKNKKDIRKKIGKFNIIPDGTIMNVGGNATGIFAPFSGKQVVLGAGGQILEITDRDIELGTVNTEYDPEFQPITAPDYDISFNLFNNPKNDGDRAQSKYFPRGDPFDGGFGGNPYDGGYRHCVATCLLVKRFGSGGAIVRTIWDLKNEVNSGLPDSPRDMQAEDIGEFLGTFPSGACDMMCLRSYPPAP